MPPPSGGGGGGGGGLPLLARYRCEPVVLFCRDFVDGAWLHRNDTKISDLLLGNLTLENVRRNRLRYGRREQRRLERAGLSHPRGGIRGPDKWFALITRCVAQQVARLVIEYNQHCIPREEVPSADPEDRALFEDWLGKKEHLSRIRRSGRVSTRAPGEMLAGAGGTLLYRTTEFNALHFLSADATRDATVRERYGPDVARYLREDRENLIRDIFGTYPLHLLPKEARTFNPYEFYRAYVSGGRIFLFPLPAAWFALKGAVVLGRRLLAVVRDVVDPGARPATASTGRADFVVARRKIHRMRRPVAMEALRMRARFDAEYLGLELPGFGRSVADRDLLEADLRCLGASEPEREELQRIRRESEARLRRLAGLLARRGLAGGGKGATGTTAEGMRALVAAFLCDHAGSAGLEPLLQAARQPAAWTEQIIAVRTVQTLAMIDLEGYDEIVRRLGRFDRDLGPPPALTGPSSGPR